MSRLWAIQQSVQQVAEAIAAALKVEVEVADDGLVRIAGTGEYARKVGRKMRDDGFIYRRVLETGQSMIIDNPGFHELCEPCRRRGNCLEKGEICCPIRVEDQTVGVFGVVSLNEEQKQQLLGNKESHLRFINKMAELLGAKVLESEMVRKHLFVSKQLKIVMNFVGEGLLVVDESGVVTHMNRYAERILGVREEDVVGHHVREKALAKTVADVLCSGEGFVRRQMDICLKGPPLTVLCSAFPIGVDGEVTGAVLTFSDMRDVSRLVYELAGNQINYGFEDLLGESEAMKRLKEQAMKVARSDSTVLIRGESGTGKEMLARAIHANSLRAKGPFITINCGAIPETLLESELFGYEEGAFTGAKKGGKLGKFEVANRGTVFLDEIGDMPLHLQVKLLRVLEEKRIEKVGRVEAASVDVRIIAATHRDLEKMMKAGEFREDLYYRLNVIPLLIPPLRERKEDILLLTEHFMREYSRILGKTARSLSPEAMERCLEYDWPGNVRELANAVEYAVSMEASEEITLASLPWRLKENVRPEFKEQRFNLQELERKKILEALSCLGVSAKGKEKAAAALGISRSTLYRKLRRYGIARMSHYETVIPE